MVRLSRLLAPAAVVAVALLVFVSPVAAATNTGFVINTTAADFNNGTVGSGLTVTGSGTSANVELVTSTTIDDFEDDDINIETAEWSGWNGDTAALSAQSSTVLAGSFSGQLQSTSTQNNLVTATRSADIAPAKIEWLVQISAQTTGGASDGVDFNIEDSSGTRFALVQFRQDGDIDINVVDQGEWAASTEYRVTLSNIDYSANTYDLDVVRTSDATTVASVSGESFQTATSGFGRIRWGNDANDGSTTVNAFTDNWIVEDIQGDAGTYTSANHSVDNVVNGFTNFTLTNANATVVWQEFTGGSWSSIRSDTYTTSGNKSVDISSATSSTLRVQVTLNDESGTTTAQLHDEGVTFTNHAPEFDNSTADPSGGTTLTASPVTFSINLTDQEFGEPQGDSVDVEFFVNGSSVGTNSSITSNGTVTFDYSPTVGGDREWHAEATDSYGGTNTSDTFAFTVPAQLQIREERSPHDRITSATATVKFFEDVDDDPEIVERTTNDGNISLSGLPVNTEFSVTVSAPGYRNRTAIIEDIFQQSSVFMLNDSEPRITNTFTVSDRTGSFSPEETEIILQAAINQSEYGGGSGFAWINIAGDDLGASRTFTTDLRLDNRYRIKVQNTDGDTRILGSYVAALNGTIEVVIGRVVLDPVGTDQPATEIIYNDTANPRTVKFEYNDSEENTTEIFLHIYEFNNASNELLANTSFTPSGGSNFGTFTNTETVPAAQNDTTWVVDFRIVRDGVANIEGRQVVGPQEDVFPELPDWLKTIIFAGTMIVVGGLFSNLNGHVGGLVIAGLGALFWFIGMAPSYLGGGVVALAMIAGGVIFVNESRQGSL